MLRKSLSDILHSDQQESLRSAWGSTEAATEFKPLPKGEYIAQIVAGEPFTAKTKGTPGYKLTFRVVDGEHADRQFWHEVWLTPAAMPMAKRDLAKLGVTSFDQLDQPLPQGIVCRVKLTLRTADDGAEFNAVKSFCVERIDPPQADPFAPGDNGPVAPPNNSVQDLINETRF
jgi:hypothetical protein